MPNHLNSCQVILGHVINIGYGVLSGRKAHDSALRGLLMAAFAKLSSCWRVISMMSLMSPASI